MNRSSLSQAVLRCIALASVAVASGASAAPLALYGGPAITSAMKSDPRACLNIGDAISCSAGMLNVLSGLSATAKTALNASTPSGFIIEAPQGGITDSIVLGANGAAALGNGDTLPAAARVEDGFKTNPGGNDSFTATGKTGLSAGNMTDPGNNSLASVQDAIGTWDVDISWLLQALTVGGSRRELMIGFDYNQPQNSTGSVDYWSLITVRDLIGTTNLAEKNFEIKNDFSGYAGFTSTKTFISQPNGNEFLTVNTKTCYQLDGGGNVINVVPTATGVCPSGFQSVNNATGNSTAEIIAFLPELNSGLEAMLAQGYDTISVRMLFGCFDKTGDANSGAGYLSGGSTQNCDGGGAVDVFLVAGALMNNRVPEPGSLALVGLALLGLGAARRRQQQH